MKRNSAFWILALAGALVVSMIIAMLMMSDLDPSIDGVVGIRKIARAKYPACQVQLRWDPPISQEIDPGRQRERILVLVLTGTEEQIADPGLRDQEVATALRFLQRQVNQDLALSRTVDHLQVDLLDPRASEAQPAHTHRQPYTGLSRRFDGAPTTSPAVGREPIRR